MCLNLNLAPGVAGSRRVGPPVVARARARGGPRAACALPVSAQVRGREYLLSGP